MTGPQLTRRRMLVLSATGTGTLALSACGTAATDEGEETDPEREAELLNGVTRAHLAVATAAGLANKANRELGLDVLDELREESADALIATIKKLDPDHGERSEVTSGSAESAVEALADALDASMATALEAIREITTDAARQLVHRSVAEDAAYRAIIADTLGEDYAAQAFYGSEDEA